MSLIPCPLATRARTTPDDDAVAWSGRVVSWRQFNAYVHSTARYLKEIHLKRGTRVAIYSPNCVEYIVTLLALWRIGACVMPLSVRLPLPATQNAIRAFAPEFLFTGEDLVWERPATVKSYPLRTLVAYTFTDGFFGREEKLSPEVDLDVEVAVVLTSGSEGDPKGVVLSYGNFWSNAEGANQFLPFNRGDSWLLSLPLWHVSGLAILFRSLAGGGAVVVPDPSLGLSETLTRYEPSHISLVPTQLKALLEKMPHPERFLKAVLLGGSPVPVDLAREAVSSGWPLYATYGLTETASQVATGKVDQSGAAHARLLVHRELRISDDGEVLVRGSVLFRRYAFGPDVVPFDAEGWYHTGDLGRWNASGCLEICGRKDNRFFAAGENFYPETIEKVLLGHPSVRQALVVAVSDPAYGQHPVAFVELASRDASLSEIQRYLEDRLSALERPKAYYAWPAELGDSAIKPGRKMFRECLSSGKAKPL